MSNTFFQWSEKYCRGLLPLRPHKYGPDQNIKFSWLKCKISSLFFESFCKCQNCYAMFWNFRLGKSSPPVACLVSTFCGSSPVISAGKWSRMALLLKEIVDLWPGISSAAINKTLLVFADFSMVNVHHTQTGQIDLYDDTTTDNLPELEHHAGFTHLSRWISKTRHSKYSFALSSLPPIYSIVAAAYKVLSSFRAARNWRRLTFFALAYQNV